MWGFQVIWCNEPLASTVYEKGGRYYDFLDPLCVELIPLPNQVHVLFSFGVHLNSHPFCF